MRRKKAKLNVEDTLAVTNELLLAILNQLNSLELILADANMGKTNMRYSSSLIDKDQQVLNVMAELVNGKIEKYFKKDVE